MKVINKQDLCELTQKSGGKFKVQSLVESYKFCESIATSHYENFPVGSILIPKKLRKYFFSVYAFARIADDIADELKDDISKRLNALDNLKLMLEDRYFLENTTGNPILLALHDTMKEKSIPVEPFQKLLVAFKKDILFTQAQNYSDLKEYSSYSANPIGELVLRIFNNYSEESAKYSDKICTGLQLINFWQDLSRDLTNNRCYLPLEILNKYNLTKENLHLKENSTNLINCLGEIYKYTSILILDGRKLIKLINNFRLKLEIKATLAGGEIILKRTMALKEKILVERPALSKKDYWSIIIKSLF